MSYRLPPITSSHQVCTQAKAAEHISYPSCLAVPHDYLWPATGSLLLASCPKLAWAYLLEYFCVDAEYMPAALHTSTAEEHWPAQPKTMVSALATLQIFASKWLHQSVLHQPLARGGTPLAAISAWRGATAAQRRYCGGAGFTVTGCTSDLVGPSWYRLGRASVVC